MSDNEEPLYLDAQEQEQLFLGNAEQERKKTATIDHLLNTAFEALHDLGNYYRFFGLPNFAELTEANKEQIYRQIDSLTMQAKQEWGRTNLARLDEFNKILNKIKANFANPRAKEKEIDAPLHAKLMDVLEARLLTYLDDHKISIDEHYTLYRHALHLGILKPADPAAPAEFRDWVKRTVEKANGVIYDLKTTFTAWLAEKPEKYFIDNRERLLEIAGYYLDLKQKSRLIEALDEQELELNQTLLAEVTLLLKQLGKPLAPGPELFEKYGCAFLAERGIGSNGNEVDAYYIEELGRIARNEFYLTGEEFERFIAAKKIRIRQIPICNFLVCRNPVKRIQLFSYEELLLNSFVHWSLALENFKSEISAIRIHDWEMADALESVLGADNKTLVKRNLPESHFDDYRIQKCMEAIVRTRLNNDPAFLPRFKLKQELDFGAVYLGEKAKKQLLLFKNSLAPAASAAQWEKNGFIYQLKITLDTEELPFAALEYNGKQAPVYNLYGNENAVYVLVDAEQGHLNWEPGNKDCHAKLTVTANDGWIRETVDIRYGIHLPELEFSPAKIGFGDVYIGEDPRKRTLRLTNPGMGDHFDLIFQPENLEFIQLSTPFIQRLEQGKEIDIILDVSEAYAKAEKPGLAASNPYEGYLNILTNSGLNSARLPVSFVLKKPELVLSATTADFGSLCIGDEPCSKTVTLSNPGKGTHSEVKIAYDPALLPGLSINKTFIKRLYKTEDIILTLDPSAMHISHESILKPGRNEFGAGLTITTNNGLTVHTVTVRYALEYLAVTEKGNFDFGAVLLGSKVQLEYALLLPEKGNLKLEETFPQMRNVTFRTAKLRDRYVLSAVVDAADAATAYAGCAESGKVTIKSTAGTREIPVTYKVFYSSWFTLLKTGLGILSGLGVGFLCLFTIRWQPDNAVSLVLYILLLIYGYRRALDAAQQQKAKNKVKPFAPVIDALFNFMLILFPPVVVFCFYNLALQPLAALLRTWVPGAGKAGVFFYFGTLAAAGITVLFVRRALKKHKKRNDNGSQKK